MILVHDLRVNRKFGGATTDIIFGSLNDFQRWGLTSSLDIFRETNPGVETPVNHLCNHAQLCGK